MLGQVPTKSGGGALSFKLDELYIAISERTSWFCFHRLLFKMGRIDKTGFPRIATAVISGHRHEEVKIFTVTYISNLRQTS